MIAQPQPLIEVFAAFPALRCGRGQRQPWPAMLSLACGAMVCGARRSSAIAAWGRTDGARIAPALGFTHNTPGAAPLHPVCRPRDRDAVEAQWGAWAEGIVVSTLPAQAGGDAAGALEGKTLRGSRKHGAPGGHRLAALAHPMGLTLAHQAVDDQTHASTQVETVLRQLVLPGRVVPLDALLTQRQVAHTLVAGGGDDVRLVTEQQRQLRRAMAVGRPLPPAGARPETARTVARGHGRSEPRPITTREAVGGDSTWPGLAQVFARGRDVIPQKTGEERVEGVDGVTSLRPARVTPGPLLALVRGHWHSEHTSHGVRDVPFDDDRSQVRCGHIPHVMAALRHTALGLLRWAGHTTSAAACRRLAAQPAQALALIGIELEN